MTIGDYKNLKKYLRSQRIKDFREAADEMDLGSDERCKVLYDLTKDPVTDEELQGFIETQEGGARLLWLILSREHKELTLEDAEEMYAEYSAKEVQAILDGSEATEAPLEVIKKEEPPIDSAT